MVDRNDELDKVLSDFKEFIIAMDKGMVLMNSLYKFILSLKEEENE